jgi:hypothetical protein
MNSVRFRCRAAWSACAAIASLAALGACHRPTAETSEPPVLLDAPGAGQLASLSLQCVDQEYPNKPGNVLEGDHHALPPRALTPVFFGCFDWHSAVHGHWTLVRLLRTFPALPEAPRIRAALDRRLTPAGVASEVAYFQAERNRTFERPYGWGWLLRLSLELRSWADPDARRWAAALEPLSAFIARELQVYLTRLSAPVREGTHSSTAFALVHALDYTRGVGDATLARLLEQRARDFYGKDQDCPTHFEPSGEDFLSPCLVEADLMRRVLAQRDFVAWLDRFLPPVDAPRFKPLLAPIAVRDPKDYRIGHLIGLAFQRASSFEGLATALPSSDPRAPEFRRLASLHARAALASMKQSGYGGTHWLASFAVFFLTRAGIRR